MQPATRNLIVTAGAAAAMCGLWIAVRAANPEPPRAAFEATERALGEVVAGESAEVAFPIRNRGGKPLQILNVQAGCGCLAPKFPKSIRPGGAGEIRTTFTPSPEWHGQVKKELTVFTNDPLHPETKLRLVSEVAPLVAVDPPSPLQIPVHRGQVVRRLIRLTPREGISLAPGAPEVNAPHMKAELKPAGDGRGHLLALTLGPCNESVDLVGKVSLKTTSPKLPLMNVVAVALQLDGPVVSPREVLFSSIESGAAGGDVTRLQVFSRSGADFKVLEAKCTVPGLESRVETDTAGRLYNVRLVRSGPLRSGRATGKIVIRTDDPKYSQLSVPVDITVR